MSVVFDPAKLPVISFKELEGLAFLDQREIDISLPDPVIFQDIARRLEVQYRSSLQAFYGAVSQNTYNVAEDVETNMRNCDLVENAKRQLQQLDITTVESGGKGVDGILRGNEAVYMKRFNDGLAQLQTKRQSIESGIRQSHQSQIDNIIMQRANLLTDYRQKLEPLNEKLNEVSQSFADMEHLGAVYRVDHPNIVFDIKKMDIKEFKKLVDLTSYAMRVVRAKSPLAVVSSVLYLPAIRKTSFQDLFVPSYLAVLLILLLGLTPWIWGVFAVFFFINLIVNIFKVYDNKRLVQIAYIVSKNREDISKQLDYLLQTDPTVMQYTRALRELEFVNLDAQVADAVKDTEAEIQQYITTTPEPRLKEIRNHVMAPESLEAIRVRLSRTFAEEQKEFETLSATIARNHGTLFAAIKEYSDTVPKFGEYISSKEVLSTEFVVAERSYQGMPVGYFKHKFPFANYIFRYNTQEERAALVSEMKLLYLNAVSCVEAGKLHTTVTDPLGMGGDFSELFDIQLESVLDLTQQTMDETLKSMMVLAKDNMLKIGNKSIEVYNTESSAAGRLTIPYKLWILLSADRELATSKELVSFMDYSQERGIWVWVLAQEVYNDKGLVDEKSTLRAPVEFRKPGSYAFKGQQISYAMPNTPKVEYDMSLVSKAKAFYIDRLVNGVVKVITYETMYRQKYIPDDKIWTFNTLKGIELHFGFLDGDPNKPVEEVLGDLNVHCLTAGQTGAGKSVLINQTLATLLHMYSPEWLELVMIDFKNVEFNMYTGDLLIPHASIISGTQDGEYAVSVFDWVLNEMARRKKQISKYKFQKIQDWNEAVLAGKLPGETIIPRMLLLFDEFQAMFAAVDPDKIDIIKNRIQRLSKEARAMGVHMWFTSQSMQGTLSEDVMEQFGLRCCLSVTSQTSKDVLGNQAAGELPKRGFCIANGNGGKEQHNHKYAVPFCSNAYIKEYLPRLIKKCQEDYDEKGKKFSHIHRHAEFYDEEFLHPVEDLHKHYKNFPALGDDPYTFLMGEPVEFTTNAIPVNLRLLNSDGENMVVHAYERQDACNLLKTMLDNLDHKEGYVITASKADDEISSLLEIDDYLDDFAKGLSAKRDADKCIATLLQEVQRREDNKLLNEPQIYYFLFGLDKIPDFETNYQVWEGIYLELLKRGPAVGVHTIIYSRDTRPLNKTARFSNHILCAKTTETHAVALTEKLVPTQMADNVCFYKRATETKKFKIYQHMFDPSKLPQSTLHMSK